MWNEIQNFVGFMILQYLSYHFNVFDNFPIVFYTPLYLNINGKAFYNIENTFFLWKSYKHKRLALNQILFLEYKLERCFLIGLFVSKSVFY